MRTGPKPLPLEGEAVPWESHPMKQTDGRGWLVPCAVVVSVMTTPLRATEQPLPLGLGLKYKRLVKSVRSGPALEDVGCFHRSTV